MDGCIGIPSGLVYSGLCFLGVGGLICTLFANFIANFASMLVGYDDEEGIKAMVWWIRFSGFACWAALACFFIFMYPNQQTTPAGCSSVVTPFGGGNP